MSEDHLENREVIELDLDYKAVPVRLRDPQTGEVKEYELREMDGERRDQYLNSLGGRMRYDSSGRPLGIKDFKGMQAGLLSRCLYDSEGKLVSDKVIQKRPSSVQTRLYQRARDINSLDEDKTEGND